MSSHNAARPLRPDSADYDREAGQESTPASFPVVTTVLLILMIGLFVAMQRAGHGSIDAVSMQFGDKRQELIRAGQWQRFITPIFLHGSWPHLITNGLSLFWFGSQIERVYGARRYLVLFLISGIAGNLFSYWFQPTPSLGASGALFGLIGAALVFPLRYRDLVPAHVRAAMMRQLIPITLLNVAFSFTPGIDKWAHFGGLIGGALLGLFLRPALLDDRRPNAVRDMSLSLLCALLLVLTAGAAFAQWRSSKLPPVIKMVTYSFGSNELRWSFSLPERWVKSDRSANGGAIWMTADGAALGMTLVPTPPDPAQLANQLRTQGASVENTTVAAKPALLAARRDGNSMITGCYAFASDQTLFFQMQSPIKSYPTASQDFLHMISSARFLPVAPPTKPLPGR